MYRKPGAYKFDPALVTFGAGMAIRAGNVFGGVPIVQGTWAGTGTPDTLSLSRGSQISGNWYGNFDPHQGSVVFPAYTPEKSTTAAVAEGYLIFSDVVRLYYWHGGGVWRVIVGGEAFSVSANLTAGTPSSIVLRWDTNNTLDGSNYACLSINDVHTFGITSQPTVAAPAATIFIGTGGANYAADGIIEGLHIYRRVFFDGTYGINTGKGDEIAAIYNSGSFADPSEVVGGSFDCTLAIPTAATPGALTTGTGNAWSHPHGSNLITPVDGFMLSTAWANWTQEGTPASSAVLADAEKIYQGGYKYTSDAANEGYYFDVTVSAGDDWAIRAIAHSDGTSVPRAILYDQTNGAEIGHLDGDVLDRVANGTFASDTKWNKDASWTIAAGVATHTPGTATNLFQTDANQQNGAIALGVTYNTSFTITGRTAGTVTIGVGSTGTGTARSTNATHTEKLTCSGNNRIYIRPSSDFDGDIDDVIVTRTATRGHPDVILFTGQAPAGCTTLRVKLINTASSGVPYWHEAQLLQNLVNNPSLETGAGNPWIPTGWNDSLEVNESRSSAAAGGNIHSGGDCIELDAVCNSDGIFTTNIFSASADLYYSMGFFGWADGGGLYWGSLSATPDRINRQTGASVETVDGYEVNSNGWQHTGGVVRSTGNGIIGAYLIYFTNGNDVWADDPYALSLDAVSLTATPATKANSTENDGLRVDGLDTCTQPTQPVLKATKGEYPFSVKQRTNPAVWCGMGNAAQYWLDHYEDANNYIRVYLSAANTITIAYNAAGAGEVTDTYDATGETWAATEKAIRVKYSGAGAQLYIDNVLAATAAGAVAFATAFTAAVSFGMRNDGTLQADAVITK